MSSVTSLTQGETLRSSLARRMSVPTGIWLALAIQTLFLVALAASDGFDAAREGEELRIALTYATVVALFALVHAVFGGVGPGPTFAVLALLVIVNFARFETTGTFDYGFVHENVRELATPFGRSLVTAQVKPIEVVAFLLAPLAAGRLLWRFPSPPWSRQSRTTAVVGCTAALIGIPASGVHTHESLTGFTTSALRFHADLRRVDDTLARTAYPFVHDLVPSEEARTVAGESTRPDVILLFLESWSAVYGDRTDADGRPYTPVFDAKRREGLTFDHFYAGSVQSSHGRFATLCSLIPLYRGKEADVLANAPLRCLPRVMADAGYHPLLTSASDTPEFERSEVFFRQIGFADVRFEDPKDRAHNPRIWGAGLQDDDYYRKFFAVLDETIARRTSQPIFAVAINASHHYPFNDNPAHVPAVGPPTKYGRNYVASLRMQDAWLRTFFEELDRRPRLANALVILVGDHSFPADEHGVHFNGLGAREESFRTAFAMLWRGHVKPRVDTDRTVSQLDVAPTIADLLQLAQPSHFVGHSLVAQDKTRAPAPMVQPYDGVRLVAVRYPYKLEVHQAAGQEHLYDLAADPDEERDLMKTRALPPRVGEEAAALRATVDLIRQSQGVLRAQRVWPANEAILSPNPTR